jgi:hypothetical protein
MNHVKVTSHTNHTTICNNNLFYFLLYCYIKPDDRPFGLQHVACYTAEIHTNLLHRSVAIHKNMNVITTCGPSFHQFFVPGFTTIYGITCARVQQNRLNKNFRDTFSENIWVVALQKLSHASSSHTHRHTITTCLFPIQQ